MDNKKLGEWVGFHKTEMENPIKWLIIVVWWLRTMAEYLKPRMSSSTSNTRNEQLNLAFGY